MPFSGLFDLLGDQLSKPAIWKAIQDGPRERAASANSAEKGLVNVGRHATE